MAPTNPGNIDIVSKTEVMAQALTPELYRYLLSLLPNPDTFTEWSKLLQASHPGALSGSPEQAKVFEAHCQSASCDLSVIQGLAKLLAVKDSTLPEKLGVGRGTARVSYSRLPLAAPERFKVSFSPEGRLSASVAKVPNAKGYQVWACNGDLGVGAEWRLVGSSSRCKNIMIVGGAPGIPIFFKVRAIRGNSFGPWSNLVSL